MPRSSARKLQGLGPKAVEELDRWLRARGQTWAPEPARATTPAIPPEVRPLTDAWGRLYRERYGQGYPWQLQGADRVHVQGWAEACGGSEQRFVDGVLRYFEAVDAGQTWPQGEPAQVRHFTRELAKWLSNQGPAIRGEYRPAEPRLELVEQQDTRTPQEREEAGRRSLAAKERHEAKYAEAKARDAERARQSRETQERQRAWREQQAGRTS
jgi:hypothetical protein